jgi:hypothetical protein
MMIHPTTRQLMKSTRIALCFGLLAAAPRLVSAQATAPGAPTALPVEAPAPISAKSAAEEAEIPPFDLNFPGGPVYKFVDMVQESMRRPFNVIIPAPAENLMMPAVRVQGVRLESLLKALSSYENPGLGFIFQPPQDGDGDTLWSLWMPPVAPQAPPQLAFHQLKPKIAAGVKVDDILTVAKTAWSMMKVPADEMPEVKYHEETGILIAVGRAESLSVIRDVLSQMPGESSLASPAK